MNAWDVTGIPADADEPIWTYAFQAIGGGVHLYDPLTYAQASARRERDIERGMLVGLLQRKDEPIQAIARETTMTRHPLVRLNDGTDVDPRVIAKKIAVGGMAAAQLIKQLVECEPRSTGGDPLGIATKIGLDSSEAAWVIQALAERVSALETDMEARHAETTKEIGNVRETCNEELIDADRRTACLMARLDESRRTIRLLSGRRGKYIVIRGVKSHGRIRVRD